MSPRDTDFVGGNIRNCVNLPEDHFQDDEDVEKLVEKYKHLKKVIFHCTFR